MGVNIKLIGFPLFVMFMITLVMVIGEAGGSFQGSSSAEFFGTREVDNSQVSGMDNVYNGLVDVFGENPNPTKDGGDWTLGEALSFIETFEEGLDYGFGPTTGKDIGEEGHSHIAELAYTHNQDYYDQHTARMTENEIRGLIIIDPVSMAEWSDLNAGSVSFSDTLVFIGIFFGVVVLVGIVGIRILGSGLAETSVNFIVKLTLFLLLWGLLSIGAGGRLLGIPIVGAVIWAALTFVYMMGVFITLSGTGDD